MACPIVSICSRLPPCSCTTQSLSERDGDEPPIRGPPISSDAPTVPICGRNDDVNDDNDNNSDDSNGALSCDEATACDRPC